MLHWLTMLAPIRLVLAVSALSLAAVACSEDDGSPTPAPVEKPADGPKTETPPSGPGQPVVDKAGTLTTVPCRFIVPKSVEGKTFSCADLIVLENRRNAASTRTIKIHVAILKGKAAGVPTVELMGGPGGGSEDLVGGLVAGRTSLLEAYGPILAKGDLVLFDQRGVGRSIPRLGCSMDVPGNPIATCRRALETEGIDLATYDTIENAEDVHDLKVALGVPQVDLHGISYGTRLGLEVMKRHPGDVRASIIDGVMPPDVPIMGMFPIAVDGILTRVFDACKADAKCNQTYPNLDASLTQLKAKLDATPFKAKDPMLGDYDYDWYAFSEELMQRFYSEGTGPQVPHWITSLLRRNQAEFQAALDADIAAAEAKYEAEDAEEAKNPLAVELAGFEKNRGPEDENAIEMALGMYLSVTCNDYAQHETIADSRVAQSKIRAVLRDEIGLEQEFDDCKVWPTRPSEATVKLPSAFTGPVLVIGGDLDPATPGAWAKHAATTLPVRQLVEVPTGGHGQMDACGAGLKGSFFTDPQKPLDASCATNRKLDFFYETPQKFRSAVRASAHAPFVPPRPGASHTERVAERAQLASKPGVVNEVSVRVHRHGQGLRP